MLLSNVIRLSRIFIYILSIVLLVTTIETKNKKVCRNNLILSIFFIFYLYISMAFLGFAGIEQGWDLFLVIPILVLCGIILIINIVICSKKLKKNEIKDENSSFIKFYLITLIILPIVFVGVSFFREISILNNSDLILTFNYQSGIVISEDTKYAIGEKFCKEISISEKFISKPIQNSGYCSYHIEHSEIANGYSITSYDDPELNQIDTVVAEMLYKDININDNEQKQHYAYLYRIKGSSYYIISHCISNTEDGLGGTVIAEYLYNGTICIDSINAKGNIETANVYSH